MKAKYLCCFLFFFLITNTVSAKQDSTRQYKNTFMLCGANYVFKSDNGSTTYRGYRYLLLWQDALVGLAYQRKIWKNIYCKMAYNEWNNHMPKSIYPGRKLIISPGFDTTAPGVILTMWKYKMADFYLLYRIDCFKRHKITAGLGVSYTWGGANEVIDSIYINPDPPHDGIIFTSERNKSYWGVVPSLSYDYLLFKNRVAVGADLKYRRYTRYPFYAPDYGFHIAVNF